jgi:NAD(P)-dependent dehydrogenase (short-subunit alcohol dehydrogenase family)
MEFKGKTAIVTGGAKGIGKAVVLELAHQGANIVIADLDIDNARQLETQIRGRGCSVLIAKTNIAHKNEVNEMIRHTVDSFGRIDILVNSAGIISVAMLADMTEEEWDTVIEVNLKGTFLCCQAAAKQMMKQKSGKIISIASMAGKTGPLGEAAYAASKAGIIEFTKVLAKELGPYGINVNAVCPGFTETEMAAKTFGELGFLQGSDAEGFKKHCISLVPLGRLGQPKDVADLILFLASEKAQYISGESVNIAGGRSG